MVITGTGKSQTLNAYSNKSKSSQFKLLSFTQAATGKAYQTTHSHRVCQWQCQANTSDSTARPLGCFPLFILAYSDSIKGIGPTSNCSLDIFPDLNLQPWTYISILVSSER